MNSIQDLSENAPAWLHGPDQHQGVVLSSRIRLARNVVDLPFKRQQESDMERIVGQRLLEDFKGALSWTGMAQANDSMQEVERQVLMERHLISREHVANKDAGFTMIDEDESIAILINEEDHVRIQAIAPGLAVAQALASALRIDRCLESTREWAFDDQFGYLTSCPTNVGTGMRAGVMLHLPALAETKELAKVLRGLSKLNMTARGQHGEGSEARGHFYQVSNQRTLGLSEADIADSLLEVVEQIVEYELISRESLMERQRDLVEDRVFRAMGILSGARRLSSDELIDQLSWLRLGLATGVIDNPDWRTLDHLLICGQRAHLEVANPEAHESSGRDIVRAKIVREALTATSP